LAALPDGSVWVISHWMRFLRTQFLEGCSIGRRKGRASNSTFRAGPFFCPWHCRGRCAMTTVVETTGTTPWWKEPTKDQWLAWWAAWLGWTLDAFDFTVFLLIMVAIAKEFGVPLTEVTVVFTITLWMRLVGAVASGWLADRIGRKTPLMISILWYSICNFIAG